MKKYILIIGLFFIAANSYSQKARNVKIKNVDGYLIESFRYDSFQHVYNADGYFFRPKGSQLSYSVFFPGQDIVLADCVSKRLRNAIKKDISENQPGAWFFCYEEKPDTSIKWHKQNMIVSNCFYVDKIHKVFRITKINSGGIFFNNLCKAYRDNWHYTGICTSIRKGPYLLFTKKVSNEELNINDMVFLNIKKANFNSISFFACD